MTGQRADVLLIGGGIMSTTLATLITELDNSRSVMLVEQDQELGRESSDAWNNAGTGHAGYCELNYTPRQTDGTIAVDRALAINERFEVSLQFWSSLASKGILPSPEQFIRRVPHLSWVQGADTVDFLRRRHATLSQHPLFEDMAFSDSPDTLRNWLPLIAGRRADHTTAMAATRVNHGSDVNFGTLTRCLGDHLANQSQVDLRLGTRVTNLQQRGGRWLVTLRHEATGDSQTIDAGFVFIGAGGASLPLLQKAGVPEARGYGGFPVSGIWLACEDPELATSHNAKVYSQAPVGAPPMSVPHLDTRFINGKPALLFGPFAGFTTRFLKAGSHLDLLRSVRKNNLGNLMDVATTQWPLTRYLIREAMSSKASRLEQLSGFLPDVQGDQWQLRRAGQRVQIIKSGPNGRGVLEFGTEVLTTADGSLSALLGASPGASTCVSAMIDVLERALPELTTGVHRTRLQSLIPSYGQSLGADARLLGEVRNFTHSTLGLMEQPSTSQPQWSVFDVNRNSERTADRGEPGSDHTFRRTGTA
ncbi:malate dehydrogenase (quinone) [Marinobacter salinisoli]|uniref:Probable malate:quinone oxidoreductase n=1 Tax=Marinobacter salinisoli TaxID=2769486 RepID=A0ABX7N039_9GAMM|nr:malate dehydrogenase (quinone) [Marinobacter salinisoli]QSP95808.1 malate dehydrogenase (quinone) [Marinobacter salinisoli]